MIRHLGYFVQYITLRLAVIHYCSLGFFYYFLVFDTFIHKERQAGQDGLVVAIRTLTLRRGGENASLLIYRTRPFKRAAYKKHLDLLKIFITFPLWLVSILVKIS